MLFSDHKELNGMNKRTTAAGRTGPHGIRVAGKRVSERASDAHVTHKSVSDGLV